MLTKPFLQINKHSVKEAGGKGASLGEMTRAGIPVPPGFVVLANAFDRFLKETEFGAEIETILKRVKHENIGSVERASSEIQSFITTKKMPDDLQIEIRSAFKKLGAPVVAVRSSATAEDSKTASWAGELETYLNVTGSLLPDYIMKCWASLFTPRAIFYRNEKHSRGKPISVAVVVQAMIQSEVSGISFTVHPVTKDRNQMVIEAGFGLGESIVGGLVTPDTYIVHKDDFSILDINVSEQKFEIVRSARGTTNKKLGKAAGSKQKLKGPQIVALAKLCKKIENHYRHPQDIEWALARGKFYILQSRPITTL